MASTSLAPLAPTSEQALHKLTLAYDAGEQRFAQLEQVQAERITALRTALRSSTTQQSLGELASLLEESREVLGQGYKFAWGTNPCARYDPKQDKGNSTRRELAERLDRYVRGQGLSGLVRFVRDPEQQAQEVSKLAEETLSGLRDMKGLMHGFHTLYREMHEAASTALRDDIGEELRSHHRRAAEDTIVAVGAAQAALGAMVETAHNAVHGDVRAIGTMLAERTDQISVLLQKVVDDYQVRLQTSDAAVRKFTDEIHELRELQSRYEQHQRSSHARIEYADERNHPLFMPIKAPGERVAPVLHLEYDGRVLRRRAVRAEGKTGVDECLEALDATITRATTDAPVLLYARPMLFQGGREIALLPEEGDVLSPEMTARVNTVLRGNDWSVHYVCLVAQANGERLFQADTGAGRVMSLFDDNLRFGGSCEPAIASAPLDITNEYPLLGSPVAALQGALSYCHAEVRRNGIDFDKRLLRYPALINAAGAYLAVFSTTQQSHNEEARELQLDSKVMVA